MKRRADQHNLKLKPATPDIAGFVSSMQRAEDNLERMTSHFIMPTNPGGDKPEAELFVPKDEQ